MIFKNREDIIENLAMLDSELDQFNLSRKIEIIIFGGTAFLFRTNNMRVTSDIDVFIMTEITNEIEAVLHRFNVNSRVSSVLEVPPIEESFKRSELLNVPFNNLIVYIASKEDLIISKLFSSRQAQKDIDDLVNTDLIDTCDMDLLMELYNEYKKDVIFPLSRYNTLEEVLELKEMKKEKK